MRAGSLWDWLVSRLFLLLAVALSPGTGLAWAQGHGVESENMELVGFEDLHGRSAYQPVIHRQGGRWIAYVGLHDGAELNPLNGAVEGNGTMVVDVTDPRKPAALSHIPGDRVNPAEKSNAQMAQVCDVAGGTYLLRDVGKKRVELWNVTDPAHPRFASTVVEGLKDTHKNWWECETAVAYLPVGDPKWRNRMTKIYDLSNPARPAFIRDFGLVGQEPGATIEPVPPVIHGPISYSGRVYFAYGSSNNGILQIVDRGKLLKKDQTPTPENLLNPQVGRLDMAPFWGSHTTYPLMGIPIADFANDSGGKIRDFLVVTSETTQNSCRGSRHFVFFVEITDPTRPFSVANFQVTESSGNFCQRGGRFGPHATNESFTPLYYKKLVFISYFNAGVRAVDVRDPFRPAEAGFYIPATTGKTKPTCATIDGQESCKVVIQTNNVEVDERGWIYIVDRAGTGMHILGLTGEARSIAGLP